MKQLLPIILLLAVPALAQVHPPDPQGGIPVSPAPSPLPIDGAIGTDGEHYFIAWSGTLGDIHGTRVSPTGAILDPEGIVIAPTYERDEAPVVVSRGENWIVFYSAGRIGTRVAEVLSSGAVPRGRTLGRVRVTDAVEVAGVVRAAVTQYDEYWSPTVHWAKLSDDLEIVDETPLTTAVSENPKAATDGRSSFVVWNEQEGEDKILRFALIGVDGQVIATAELAREPSSSTHGFPGFDADVAWNGNRFLVVWRQHGIQAASYDPQSGNMGTFAMSEEETSTQPSIAAAGGEAIVTWSHGGEFVGARLISETVVDRFPLTDGQVSAVATNGDNFLMIAGGMARLIETSVTPPRINPSYPVTYGFRSQPRPEIVVGDTILLTLPETDHLEAWRFTRDGKRLDPADQPIVIDQIDLEYPKHVAKTSSTDQYLLAWNREEEVPSWFGEEDVVGLRVSHDGTILDAEPFVIVPATEGLPCRVQSVASDGSEFLVAYACTRTAEFFLPALLRTARVSAEGEVLRIDDEPIVPHEYSQTDSSIVWTGTAYQLAWNQHLNLPPFLPHSPPATYEVRTVQLDRSGELIDGTLHTLSGVMENSEELVNPDVATNGQHVLVAWSAGAELLSLDGVPSRSFSFDEQLPDVKAIWTGGDYFLWAPDTRRVTRIDPSAAATHLSTSELFDAEGTPLLGGVAPLYGSRLLMTYTTRWTPRPQAHSEFLERAYYRITGGVRRRGVRR